jgi:predicted transcriptional regulator
MLKTKTVTRTISMPKNISDFLNTLAIAEDRSISWLCVQAIKKYWMKQVDYNRQEVEL